MNAVGVRGVCRGCYNNLEWVKEPKCQKCGKPLSEDDEYCLDCMKRKSTFEKGYGVFVYNSSMQESIGKFKYHGRQEYGKFYAEEMYKEYGEWIKTIGIQAIIPVPIHKRRCRKRGYNQAEIIAQELGKLSGIPVLENFLLRIKDTLPQKELSDRERKENLYQAFQVRTGGARLNQIPKCVILIDDIYTTGSTLEECSKVLKNVGVKKIFFLCVCIGKG